MRRNRLDDEDDTKTSEQSDAYTFVQFIWQHAQTATGHSWTRFNGALHQALELAITAGLKFEVTDITAMNRNMRGSYWMGGTERFYATAIKYANESACKACEHALNRPPTLFGGHRLHVDAAFQWKDVRGKVTSFSGDGKSLVLCSYEEERGAPKRRLTVSLDEIRTSEKGRVQANKLSRDCTIITETMSRMGHPIADNVVSSWNKRQRAAAMAWLRKDHWKGYEDAPEFLAPFLRKSA